MIKKKPDLYANQITGDIRSMTAKEAKKAGSEWNKIQFVKNQEGQDVMRFTFIDDQGNRATVDVSQGEDKEIEIDGNGNPK